MIYAKSTNIDFGACPALFEKYAGANRVESCGMRGVNHLVDIVAAVSVRNTRHMARHNDEFANPTVDMVFEPRFRMGPPPRSFVDEAHDDCIMVSILTDQLNTRLWREFRAFAGLQAAAARYMMGKRRQLTVEPPIIGVLQSEAASTEPSVTSFLLGRRHRSGEHGSDGVFFNPSRRCYARSGTGKFTHSR